MQVCLPCSLPKVSPKSSGAILQKCLLELSPKGLFQRSHSLSREFSQISSQELQGVLGEMSRALSDSEGLGTKVEQLGRSIPLEKLKEMVPGALEEAKGMFEEARLFLKYADEPCFTFSLRTRITSLIDAVIAAMESIISAFGIAEFFKPAENDFHADMKAGKIVSLLHLFSFVSTLLLPLVSSKAAALIIGGFLVVTSTLSLLFPYISRPPAMLPFAKNWSRELRQGCLQAMDVRRGRILDQIASALTASNELKTHPMLIGPSGVGKTETIKAFVKAIEEGQYPHLKGKQVFYINTADIVHAAELFGSGNRSLSRINEKLGRHREQMILVFDEIHLACQDKEDSSIGEQLKTLLDPGCENFPYVIGITTEEEFYRDIYRAHPAFARRFKRINIESMDAADTKDILRQEILKKAPHALLEAGALDFLFEKVRQAFPGSPEPAASLRILAKCLQRIEEIDHLPLEKKREGIEKQIHSLRLLGAVERSLPSQTNVRREKVRDLKQELREVESAIQRGVEELKRFAQCQSNLATVNRILFKTVAKIESLQKQKLPIEKDEHATFVLCNHFLVPEITQQMKREAHRLGFKAAIDQGLISEVIREELKSEEKIQAGVARGKNQIQDRAELK
jgi:hypothetical protein